MSNQETKPKVGDFVIPARAALADLFRFPELKREQWFMRISAGGHTRGWELLTRDTQENNKVIKQRIQESEAPVTDLVLAFIGLIQWRGRKRLMAYMQYFRRDYPTSLVFGSHVKQTWFSRKLRTNGGLLVMGSCQNIWI